MEERRWSWKYFLIYYAGLGIHVSNPTRTVAISKAVALLDINVGIRINYDNR